MSSGDLWQGVLYLHLLAMAFFVGGQLFLGVAVVPAERRNPDRERLRAVARRFGYGSLVALVLVLTGVHLRRPQLHALQAGILLASLVIVWLGLDLAT